MTTILNCSKYSLTCKYIVAREVDGEWWFYGAWNNFSEAMNAATAEGGQVFPSDEVNAEVWE